MIFRQFFASIAFRILHLFSSRIIVFIPESLIFMSLYFSIFLIIIQRTFDFDK